MELHEFSGHDLISMKVWRAGSHPLARVPSTTA
jgi:hypothetical protein